MPRGHAKHGHVVVCDCCLRVFQRSRPPVLGQNTTCSNACRTALARFQRKRAALRMAREGTSA